MESVAMSGMFSVYNFNPWESPNNSQVLQNLYTECVHTWQDKLLSMLMLTEKLGAILSSLLCGIMDAFSYEACKMILFSAG